MQSQQIASRTGLPASPVGPVDSRRELERLRSACRRQAHVIELLSAAVSTLRSGVSALRAENAELRGGHDGAGALPAGDASAGEALEVSLPLDTRAPGAARIVVDGLCGRVPPSVLDCARLVVSELVADSVVHCDASAGEVVVVRVQIADTLVRLEVWDPGSGGLPIPQTPDRQDAGGLGLNIVQTLSERWGVERAVAGGTRIWAQLPSKPSSTTRATAGGRERRDP